MDYERSNLPLGAIFYVLGAAITAFVLRGFSSGFSFHPAIELTIISLGTLALTIFFYSRFSYIVLFVVGVFFGQLAFSKPLFVALAFFPLMFAHWLGLEVAYAAKEDFSGKGNLFAQKQKFILLGFLLVLLSAIAGLVPEYIVFA